ncbi:recombinase family protein [Sphingobium sp. B7D2B]|uniref:recombinase family protein n=1 Tax=Sphingobium sp. B7D2B TaxID=2940583 RepID=UPI00222441FB|nr:recombinase family protein [Sphingobium sp. B7D2B]
MTKTKRLPAFGYVRVSTDEQEENRTSIESQISAVESYAHDHGYQIIEMFIEPAASGRNQRRPKFLQMIALATAPDHPVEAIIGWAQSRLWRDLETHVNTRNSLSKARVALLSVTQSFGNDSNGQMLGNMTAMFDEHFARETAKHTRRTMRANAEEGFYNGGRFPFGYEARTVEVRGKKEKRRLFINEQEAVVVRLIYDLADHGEGEGPMGGRAIAGWLNDRGYTLRGKPFYNGTIASILSQPHYLGRYSNMTVDENGDKLPETDWVWVECPPIIDPEQAARIATSRAKRSPKVTAPRIVSGPTLLTGKVRCGMPDCGAGFTMATGKGGRYRYYRCNRRTNAGAGSCKCPAVRVEKLDAIVVDALLEKLFTQERLAELLARVMDVSDQAQQRQRAELGQCRAETDRSQAALSRLLDLVAQGIMSPRDPALAEKLSEHRARIATLSERANLLERQLNRGGTILTPDLIKRFSQLIRDRLRDDESPLRRSYVRMFVDEVIVGAAPDKGSEPHIIVRGSQSTIETAVISAAVSTKGQLPIFDREWCRLGDSNT